MSKEIDDKIDEQGKISSDDTITEKEGYDAMLYMLRLFWEETGSTDLTDILSGGEYMWGDDKPADIVFWERWLEAIQKQKKDGPPPLKFSDKPWF